MPVYRYKQNGPTSLEIQTEVPGSPTIDQSQPYSYLDITLANSAYKTDLDEAMSRRGYSYDSQDPTNRMVSMDASGVLNIGETSSTPSVPTYGVSVFSKSRAGRRMLAQVGPSGVDYSLQPVLFANKIGWWTANGNGTTVSVVNLGNSTTGTATTRNVTTASFAQSLRRIGYVSAATAGSSAGTRHNALQFWAGNETGSGGYFYCARFVVSQVTATSRLFIGLWGSAAAMSNAQTSTRTNVLGFGTDSGQTTMRWFYNNASGTASSVDLGSDFPTTTVNVAYDARIFCPPNGTTIFYALERLGTPYVAEGFVDTNIPLNTQLLSPQIWINNGTTAAACAIDVVSQYIETDF